TIVDEQPAEVFRQLYLREKAMRFKAAPEADASEQAAKTPAADPKDAPAQTTLETLLVEDEGLALDFVPYDSASLDNRYTDDWLQTTSSPEALDKSLRRLDEQA